MSSPQDLQKLRVKAAYLWGLGIGITVTALEMTPKSSQSNDKYNLTTLLGVLVILAAIGMSWYVRRKEVIANRSANTAELLEKK